MWTAKQLLERLEKAIIQTSDFSGGSKGGLLPPEIADKFVDYVYDMSKLKNNARLMKITPDQKHIDKVAVGSRVALPKSEAVKVTERRGVSTERITINTKPIAVPWEISRETLARNIEGESFEDTVARLMATQLANDLEELFIQGDTGSSDPYLALLDGWGKLADGGHVVDAGRKCLATLGDARKIFGDMIRSMPKKFLRDRSELRFIAGTNVVQDYIDALSERATALGDQALQQRITLTPFGIPLIEIPLLPTNQTYGSPAASDNSFILLTHFQNLITAIEVQYAGSATGIELLKDTDIFGNTRQYCMHLSQGCALQEKDAMVKAVNLRSSAG